MPYTIFPLSDQAITFSFGHTLDIAVSRRLVSMRKWLSLAGLPGVEDIVVAYSSLTIHYNFLTVWRKTSISPFSFFGNYLEQALHNSEAKAATSNTWEIPVCYAASFGPDLERIAEDKGFARQQVVDIHTSTEYHVFMIGFLPGFPYLGEVDSRIQVPRKPSPLKVRKGSVGIAGKQTGIYPTDSPGGWQIIGRTPLALFNALSHPPVQIEIGDTVKFFEISEIQFNDAVAAK